MKQDTSVCHPVLKLSYLTCQNRNEESPVMERTKKIAPQFDSTPTQKDMNDTSHTTRQRFFFLFLSPSNGSPDTSRSRHNAGSHAARRTCGGSGRLDRRDLFTRDPVLVLVAADLIWLSLADVRDSVHLRWTRWLSKEGSALSQAAAAQLSRTGASH